MLKPGNSMEKFGIDGLHKAFLKKAISPVEYMEFVLRQTEKYKSLNLFITQTPEMAMEQAAVSEKRYMKGEPAGVMDGVPVAVKDMFDLKGTPTTQGCEIYKDAIAREDAFVIARLRNEGAVFPGKVNTSQFAMGPMGDVSHIGPCRNPHDPDRVTGGSSSGSAAAVAANVLPCGIGTDTGGSIRMPASLCGVVGLKTTYMLVSSAGVKPLALALDTIGPLTRNVKDNALLLNILAGYNPLDWRTLNRPVEDYTTQLDMNVKGGKLIYSEEWNTKDMQPEIAAALSDCLGAFRSMGTQTQAVSIPDLSLIRKAHQLVLCAGGHAAHKNDLENNPEAIFDQVTQRLISGNISSDEYLQSLEVKNELIALLYQLMGDADVFLLPATPTTATRIGEETILLDGKEHAPITTHPRFTWIANFSGFPAISLPVGYDRLRLPIGLSMIAKPFHEATLYRYAANLERALNSVC